ncbi:MAG: thiamine diphosphokinase [Clostridiales bacterium]|nr:thiamine diphosphokinase [Clostridiales bacterium]HOA33903.1 thiamine diphosphokinase [Clostridiales bacterium]HPP67629.1 thiamine diphosphokinase [Clostridiales bacterium]HQA05911.1 thiamine diphosphokinase [Clostridiales bacterium]HXK83389.1 thiamine diphosphokinase [Clostridiales bacterium]
MTDSMDKKCIIVGAGDFTPDFKKPSAGDIVIAADGGLLHLQSLNIRPDILIGDFDSLNKKVDSSLSDEIIRLKIDKDYTDTYAAAKIGLERGFKTFELYACTGGARFDHTLSNIQLLAFLIEQGCDAYIAAPDFMLTGVKNGKLSFGKEAEGYVSVFSHTDISSGVTLKGLKYPLNNATINSRFPIGVSNRFMGTESSIEVKDGILIVSHCLGFRYSSKESF